MNVTTTNPTSKTGAPRKTSASKTLASISPETRARAAHRKAKALQLDERVLVGDAYETLKTIESGSIDALITDPPYGLTAELGLDDTRDLLQTWLTGGVFQGKGAGYNGNAWDSAVPSPVLWAEALRTLKPGAWGAVFASSRTVDMTTFSLRLAGFEIRDTLHWTYGSGRTATRDLGKQFDALGETELARKHAGQRASLRPSHEPIVLVRKPLGAKTLRENIRLHGVGGLNLLALDPSGKIPSNTLTSHGERCRPEVCHPDCLVADRDRRNPPKGGWGTPSNTITSLWPVEDTEGFDPALYVAKPHASVRVRTKCGLRHDTEKPQYLMRRLIDLLSAPGQTVLDPFLGSGTTAEAAIQVGRDFRGCEREAAYLELIDTRLRRAAVLPPYASTDETAEAA